MLEIVIFLWFETPETNTSHFWRFGTRPERLLKESRVSLIVLIVEMSALDRMKRSSTKAREFSFKASHFG